MAKKKRKTKADRSLTLADVDSDLEKAYRYIGQMKYAHARQALTRARRRLHVIRGLPEESRSTQE